VQRAFQGTPDGPAVTAGRLAIAKRSETRAEGEEVADDIPRVFSFQLHRSRNERFKDKFGMILGDADQGLRCARR
jgi:hypothetical protein